MVSAFSVLETNTRLRLPGLGKLSGRRPLFEYFLQAGTSPPKQRITRRTLKYALTTGSGFRGRINCQRHVLNSSLFGVTQVAERNSTEASLSSIYHFNYFFRHICIPFGPRPTTESPAHAPCCDSIRVVPGALSLNQVPVWLHEDKLPPKICFKFVSSGAPHAVCRLSWHLRGWSSLSLLRSNLDPSGRHHGDSLLIDEPRDIPLLL